MNTKSVFLITLLVLGVGAAAFFIGANPETTWQSVSFPNLRSVSCADDTSRYQPEGSAFGMCVPNGWTITSSEEGKLSLMISPDTDISIGTSNEYIEDALKTNAGGLYIDTTDRNYSVSEVPAIFVTGSRSKSSEMKAVTVFTNRGTTYAVVLSNPRDATYADNLASYKKVLESFRFVK